MVLPLLAALAAPAAAQDLPKGFPLDRPFKAISISGFDVQKMNLSLTVSWKPGSDELRGAGNAGCNLWTAAVVLHDGQIDFANITTTKRLCPKPQMTAEDAFLTSLRSARRWHVEGDKFIIEGDATRLLLKPGVAEQKTDKKPGKRRPAH
jgi:heat shock protein HslJ